MIFAIWLCLNCYVHFLEYTTYKLRPALTEEWADLADKDNSLLSAERVVQKFSTLVKQATDDINAAGDQKYKYGINYVVSSQAFCYDCCTRVTIPPPNFPFNVTILENNEWFLSK